MRFYGLALLASAAVLGACGGGEKPAADTTKAPPAAAAPAPAPATPAAGALAPIAATGCPSNIEPPREPKACERTWPATWFTPISSSAPKETGNPIS